MDFMFLTNPEDFGGAAEEESAPLPPEREVAALKEQLAALRKELATKTVQLSRRDQADRSAQERWAQERAAQLAASAAPDKDARIASLENSVRQLEAALAERAEELDSATRLQNHYKQRAKEALAAAAEREADGESEAERSRSAAAAAAEEELELLHQELGRARARAAVEADVARRGVAEAREALAAAEAEKEKAVREALESAAAHWQERLDEAQREADEQVAELQDEVVRLRSAAEATLRSAAENQFAVELSTLTKAKIQVQRECEALRDMSAQAAAQHREELARWMQENAGLKARIASDAAQAAMDGRVLPSRAGKTFGALHSADGAAAAAAAAGGLAVGAFESVVAGLERRRRGLAPLLAVVSVVLLVALVATVRSAAGSGRLMALPDSPAPHHAAAAAAAPAGLRRLLVAGGSGFGWRL